MSETSNQDIGLDEEWQREGNVECVSCPRCAFTFDATHILTDGSYSCPNCAEESLLEQLEAERSEHADTISIAADRLREAHELREQLEDMRVALDLFVNQPEIVERDDYIRARKEFFGSADGFPARSPEGAGIEGATSRLAGAQASRSASPSPQDRGVSSHPLPEDSNQESRSE